jgi:hypothetical protein
VSTPTPAVTLLPPPNSPRPPRINQNTGPQATVIAEQAADGVTPAPRIIPDATDLARETPPPLAAEEFSTDFSKHLVSYADISSGGPPKDGIKPIDKPTYVSVTEADEWLKDQEPVILVQRGSLARAYPVQILIYHEIVNDWLDSHPILVTFCPLCNTAIAFSRELEGEILSFSSTGRIRFSNLIMYDRQTESWWQQATGEGIVGHYTGQQLAFLPAIMIAWEDFKDRFPEGDVLSRDTGFNRQYGYNPYPGYDDINESPFLYDGPPIAGQLPAMARVLTIEEGPLAVAYPYDLLAEVGVVNDRVGEKEIVVFWQPGAASPFDNIQVFTGERIGAAAAYSRDLEGQRLTFQYDGTQITDLETSSVWDVTGFAVQGPLAGQQLQFVIAINHFWFSWAAFKPDTVIYQPDS